MSSVQDENFLSPHLNPETDITEKDEAELQLEKLVFGDNEGFKEGLKSFSRIGELSHEASSGDDQDNEELDLATLNDADVSMMSHYLPICSSSHTISFSLLTPDRPRIKLKTYFLQRRRRVLRSNHLHG